MTIHFFDLPTEIRDLIYVQCVLINGGYVLDFDSNTLRGADGKPIDLSFRLACRRIASETRGLALSSNVLNFSTVYSDNATAGRGIWDDIAKAHPRFAQYVELRRNRPNRRINSITVANVGPPGSCGETPSAFRNFICSVLETFKSNQDRLDPEQVKHWICGYAEEPPYRLETLLGVNPSPWKTMSSDRIEENIHSMGSQFSKTIEYFWDIPRHTTRKFPGLSGNSKKNSYSAASVAIRFLDSLSPDSRMSIRSIVLNEDQRSVAFSECHALGLIPYCRENMRLHIDRRVTIWILEDLELQAAGMPPGCFTLTLDGDSTCSEIFQTVVRRDAVWQRAIDLCLERNILPALAWDVRRRDSRNIVGFPPRLSHWARRNEWYLFEAFPQAIEDILAGRSFVKCSFELGDAWGETCDVERLIEENKSKTMDE
ncbi:hypothetical protein CSOJ01_07274 [Colletotrichum sojae]|uniref:Uncharacterized protein n=1 Tax=Colletotrichum sojae TaxID=2175907 RepID=A0A8H6JA37_9PEZI|nr:hypothetical protein CSOJ01_07274 [Colletotrichum sojae]